jgi:integrase
MPRKPQQLSGVFEKNPGSGVWYIRYRQDGAFVRKRIGDRATAIDALNRVRLIKATGQGVVAKTAKGLTLTQDEIDGSKHLGVRIGELCDAYLAYIQDPNNPRRPKDQVNPPHRLAVIKEQFGNRAAGSIMPYEVEDWLTGMGKAPATLNRYRSTFSSVYRHAMERAKVTTNPVRQMSQFKVELPHPRWLLPAEEKRLRDVLQKKIDGCPASHQLTKLALRVHPIELTFALGTGLRKSNQYSVTWEDHVDMESREFHLPPNMTKRGKALTIPMIDDVYEALVELQEIQTEIAQLQRPRASRHRPTSRMKANGRVFSISENREWWAAALKDAKIKNFRWHDLRHSFATRLMAHTKNLKLVQEACDHASITTTSRYAHVNRDELAAGMAGLNRTR